VNPYSDDWHQIALKLNYFGDGCCGAGDFSGFDGCQRGQIHQAIVARINEWYDDGQENAKIRRILFADMYNSRHIRGKDVIEWHGGLTSGSTFTAGLNCIYNFFGFMYVFGKCTGWNVSHMARFNEFVKVIFMGDDNAYAVHPALHEEFLESRLAEHFAELGMKYTDELKTGEFSQGLRNLSDLSFCKRSFKFDKEAGKYVGPLNEQSIIDSLYWFKKNQSDEQYADKITFALSELSLHGKDVFDKYVYKIEKISRLCKYPVFSYDYSCHRQRVGQIEYSM